MPQQSRFILKYLCVGKVYACMHVSAFVYVCILVCMYIHVCVYKSLCIYCKCTHVSVHNLSQKHHYGPLLSYDVMTAGLVVLSRKDSSSKRFFYHF